MSSPARLLLNGRKVVDKLSFPVKPAARLGRAVSRWKLGVRAEATRRSLCLSLGLCVTLSLALTCCGFVPARSSVRRAPELSVVAAAPKVPDFTAVQAALTGARTELSRWGKGSDAAYPRMVIELIRVEELPAGISISAERATPSARGIQVAVIAQAWVETAPGSAAVFGTGDLTRTAQVAARADVGGDVTSYGSAVNAAAAELGRDLARSILALPIADTVP